MKFADDTKVFRAAYSIHDCETLQQDLNKIVNWTNQWQMLFNISKCKVMHIGHNNINFNYEMNGQKLSNNNNSCIYKAPFANKLCSKALAKQKTDINNIHKAVNL